MMKIFRNIVVFLFAEILPLEAQNPWTLEQCIQYAMDNNIQIKRQELTAKISRGNYIQSILAVSPDLNAFGRHNLSSGKTVNLEDYTYINTTFYDGYAGAQSQVILFGGLQNINTISRSKYDLMASIQDVEKAKNDIVLNITVGYLQVLLDHELLKITVSQHQTSLMQVENIRRMVELGKLAKGQLLEMQAQASADQLNVTIARNRLNLSTLKLAQLLYLDSVADFRVHIPEYLEVGAAALAADADEVFSYAITALPEIRSAEYNLKSSKKALAVARGARYPQLSLTGTLYTRYSELAVDPLDATSAYSISNQLDDNFYKQISLSLNIPIFNNYTIQNRISTARMQMLDAGYRLEQARNDLYQLIRQAHADALAAFDKYTSAMEAVASMEEAFNYTEQKFELGTASSVDYTVAKNNLARTQSELMQAKYEYLLRTRILDFYMGRKISL